MNRIKKFLVLSLVTILLSSLNVQSAMAPNQLELTEGIIVSGDLFQQDILGTFEFSVGKFWHDPFFDVDLVEMTRNMTDTPPYVYPFNISKQIITSLLIEDNRTNLLPAVSYLSEYNTSSGFDTIIFFFNLTGSLDIQEEDIIVTYHGVNYTVMDIDPMSELYANISMWYLSFMVGNAFEIQLMPMTRYAISPQATIGQEIDYGNYTGDVTAFKEYKISETEKYDAIEVHHEEVVQWIDIFHTGSPEPYIIGETTFLYEKQTGIVLHWLEYNSTTDEYYYFNATNVFIPPVISEYSVPTLILLSTILIAIPVIIMRKRKK